MKKILVLTGSPRHKGNSDLLAQSFAEGAKKAGHEVTIFNAGQKKIAGCIACETCYSKGKPCSFDDAFNELAPLMERSDALVIVTPLYWFTFSAQIKSAIDKMFSFLVGEKTMAIKESLLLCCAETNNVADFDGIMKSFDQISAYKEWANRGHLLVPGVLNKGDVSNTNALEKAAELGENF